MRGTRPLGPRLVVAGTASGVGKTTVATGIMAALRHKGVNVAAAKIGPDFIDPGYHSVATGRPGRNLDSWICGEAAIAPLAGRAASGSDILVIEGVMGLFDGASGEGPDASTASIAAMLDAPVVLVVDASAMSRSVAAMVTGYRSFRNDLNVCGVILNKVGSATHEELLREALDESEVPVFGVLRRDASFAWRDRHLGLVPVAEHPEQAAASVRRLGEVVSESVDLGRLMEVADRAPKLHVADPAPPAAPTERLNGGGRGPTARIAVAEGRAFSFVYRDNLEAMEAAGAELLSFDPMTSTALPDGADALYVGGGFPEVYAEELGANRPLMDDVRRRVSTGMTTWAECGGMLWLARSMGTTPLAGLIDAEAQMTRSLVLGYRTATVYLDNPVAARGTELRGHEFHYSSLRPAGDALLMRGRNFEARGGYAGASFMASYLHLHLGGDPQPAQRFVSAASRSGPSRSRAG